MSEQAGHVAEKVDFKRELVCRREPGEAGLR